MAKHHEAPTPLDTYKSYHEGVITHVDRKTELFICKGSYYVRCNGAWANCHPPDSGTNGAWGIRYWMGDYDIHQLFDQGGPDLRTPTETKKERITLTIDIDTDLIRAKMLEDDLIDFVSEWQATHEGILDFDVCIDKIKE